MIKLIYYARNPHAAGIVGAALLLGVSCGCSTWGRRPPATGTQSDRLMKTYPELESGRFAVLADFESPTHMELVQFISVTPDSSSRLDKRKGRPETGRGCLALTCGSQADSLVLNNDHARNWYLKRDWQGFDLLLMSVHVPRPDLKAVIQIAAGSGPQRLSVESSIPLKREWNVIRLDLAEIGEHLPLDDVQEIRLAFAGAEKPINAYVDDILLVCNRRDLFGDSENRHGRLYVKQIGRRWSIGAGGRFELTFANGQVIQWFNLAVDPYRLRNLVQGTTLGPSPVALEPAATANNDFAGFGTAVVVRPQILEMNQVRIVLASEWRYVDEKHGASPEHRPFQRWKYTIYPTGQIYVQTEFTAGTDTWSPGPLGLAVTMAAGREGNLETYATQDDHSAPQKQPRYAAIHNRSADASLLFVPANSTPPLRFEERRNEPRRRLSMIAARPGSHKEVDSWLCHIFLSGDGDLSMAEARARASAYVEPAPLRLELGAPADPASTLWSSNGFDASAGCYSIVPDRGRVRMYIDGRDNPVFTPVFRIINAENRQAQVYVNHAVFEQFDYDADHSVVFQLPETIRNEVLIEVLFRRQPIHTDG